MYAAYSFSVMKSLVLHSWSTQTGGY